MYWHSGIATVSGWPCLFHLYPCDYTSVVEYLWVTRCAHKRFICKIILSKRRLFHFCISCRNFPTSQNLARRIKFLLAAITSLEILSELPAISISIDFFYQGLRSQPKGFHLFWNMLILVLALRNRTISPRETIYLPLLFLLCLNFLKPF